MAVEHNHAGDGYFPDTCPYCARIREGGAELRSLVMTEARQELRGKVRSSLDSALANGYDFLGMTTEEIAVDIGSYAPDLEGADPTDLIPIIAEWQENGIAEETALEQAMDDSRRHLEHELLVGLHQLHDEEVQWEPVYGLELHLTRPDGTASVWAITLAPGSDETATGLVAGSILGYVNVTLGLTTEQLEDSKA